MVRYLYGVKNQLFTNLRLFGYVFIVMIIMSPILLFCKSVEATIMRTEHKPVIDGVLNDSTWMGIEPITEFILYWPEEGIPPSDETELYIAYDDDYFYLAFKCYDSDIGNIRATMTQRESWEDDDCIGFAFDPDNDERDGFLFNVNPYGIPSDFIWHYDGYTDNGWDSDVRSKGKIYAEYYIIEIAIPFKSLRMPQKEEQEWGFYALRSMKHSGEFVVWPSRTRSIPNLLSQASLLKGIRDINIGRNISFLPYVFSSHAADTAQYGRDFDAGTDIRCGITSNTVLDATLNPDYSQIEADPDRIVLNERYVEHLPEKRPFFTEGTDIFASDQFLFYSRTIRNPIAGSKLTGRIGPNRIGFLSAIDEGIDPGETNKFLNHLRIRSTLPGESSLGLLMTNKDDFQNSTYNRVLSIDGFLRLKRIYTVKSQISRSYTRDSLGYHEAMGFNGYIERYTPKMTNSIWYNDFPDDFDAQSGYMLNVLGFREIGLSNGVFFRAVNRSINEIGIYGGGRARLKRESNEIAEDYYWLNAEVSTNNLWLQGAISENHEMVNDVNFKYRFFEIEVWNQMTRFYDHYASVIWGEAAHYSEGFTGWKLRVKYSATIKPMPRIVYNMEVTREDFYHEFRGHRSYLQTVVWNKLSCQIVPSMFIRAIYQYNSLYETSNASILFSYEYRPLSNIYLGANFNDFSTMSEMDENVELFAKIGYLWRL
jgi:hypothetical protein